MHGHQTPSKSRGSLGDLAGRRARDAGGGQLRKLETVKISRDRNKSKVACSLAQFACSLGRAIPLFFFFFCVFFRVGSVTCVKMLLTSQ